MSAYPHPPCAQPPEGRSHRTSDLLRVALGEPPTAPSRVMVVSCMMLGDLFGAHRVLEPRGVLPQPAAKLDNDTTRCFDSEIHVAVETLNIDAASFRQMEGAAAESATGGSDSVGEIIRRTVEARGKQHNPVTGSGGCCWEEFRGWAERQERGALRREIRVATLASLSLTPLRLTQDRAP